MRKWWWLIVATVLLLGGVLYAIFGQPPQPAATKDKKVELVEFKGADLKQEENGKLVWKLTAEKIMLNPQTKVLYLNNMEALFTDGENQVHVKAAKGEVDNAKKLVRMEGSIEMRNNRDMYVYVSNLTYDGTQGILSAKDGVRMKRGDVTLVGDTLVADRGLRKATVKGHAHLTKGE